MTAEAVAAPVVHKSDSRRTETATSSLAATGDTASSSQSQPRHQQRSRRRGKGAAASAAAARGNGPSQSGQSQSSGRGDGAGPVGNSRSTGQDQAVYVKDKARRADAQGSASHHASQTTRPGRGRRRGGPQERNGAQDPASLKEQISSHGLNPAAKEYTPATQTKPARRNNRFATRLTQDKDTDVGSAGASKDAALSATPIDYTDLRSRLIAELSSEAYDCSICYASIAVRDAVWSCSQCHSVLHLNCIAKWAKSSVAKMEEQNAMQEDAAIRARRGTWRCPGCQYARQDVPAVYKCWDGRVKDPRQVKGAPPHSCGKPCAQGKCAHGCAAGMCHPGPCPPCPITITRGCFCGAQQVSLRCSQLAKSAAASGSEASSSASSGVSCGGLCGKTLRCGSHKCTRTCHDGECGSCDKDVMVKCYCGRNEMHMRCGTGVPKLSSPGDLGQATREWTGRWSCRELCQRAFDCGKHQCQRACHALDEAPAPCPMSPVFVQRCPCGAEPLNANRTKCTDPIETCDKTCNKLLDCKHACQESCHLGDCPPCSFQVTTPCRCGETRRQLSCHQRQREESEGGQEVLCNTLCRSQRLCGKHECGRRCCPLYFQAKNKSKRKPTYNELLEQDPAGLHTCDKPCDKLLKCGRHHCAERCHRGQCPPCLQASFDELICHCGRTVMEPPVPCGTVIRCHFPCTRPPPSCGHPKQQHDCHGDDEACPPCIFLVEKRCMCGKHMVPSVPCHRSRVSCGHTCERPLACGGHRCQRPCHEDGCGPCDQLCTKPRKCGHPCPELCHAPAACPNKEPCQAWVTLLCACGNIQQRVRCGQSIHNPVGPNRTLQCNDSCLVAQRNTKLAEALGLSAAEQQARSLPREYPTSALVYYANNSNFAKDLERSYTDFIRSFRHAMLLAPTSTAQRNFMHDLASVFRLQTEDVDDEPRRAVAVRRTQFAQPPEPSITEAYRQHQERIARLRPTALNPMRRSETPTAPTAGSGTSTPLLSVAASQGFNEQMNALLLRGVFGIDEPTLLEALRRLPGASTVPMHVRWHADDEVVVTVSNATTAKLLAMKSEVRNAGLLNNGFSRLARDVVVCLADEHGKVLRLETPRDIAQAGGPQSRDSHSSSTQANGWRTSVDAVSASSRTAAHTTSGVGWAAVAAAGASSGAGDGLSSRPRPNAWSMS